MNWHSAAAYAPLLALAGFIAFSRIRLKSYLHIFQQEEYDNRRFLKWLWHTQSLDHTASAAVLVVLILSSVMPQVPSVLWYAILGIVFVAVSERERRHNKHAKKPLVMTKRASRTYWLAWAILILCAADAMAWVNKPVIWLVPIHLSPLVLVFANIVLMPFEEHVKARYWDEAHDKLEKLKPFIIGITGSYGKTSVKHILGHVLQFHGPTLMTPGSVNTQMGIARIVREQLRPSHKYFLAEMGAYGPGSIEGLCKLAPPDLGILTAVGSAHLERFGSRETTAKAKMELASAVLAKGGRMVLNRKVADIPVVESQMAADAGAYITVGEADADIVCSDVVQTREGLAFDIVCDGETHKIEAPLFGRHHALNIALAFAAAKQIGMSADAIVRALKTVPQIAHRLDVRRQPNGSLLIDDAYNSNPSGFESGLELLRQLVPEAGRAFLVTPGMVELGKEHDMAHRRLGETAAIYADVVYVVAPERIKTFLDGLKGVKGREPVVETFPTFQEAQARMLAQMGPNDVVLIENDLPDLYERKMQL